MFRVRISNGSENAGRLCITGETVRMPALPSTESPTHAGFAIGSPGSPQFCCASDQIRESGSSPLSILIVYISS